MPESKTLNGPETDSRWEWRISSTAADSPDFHGSKDSRADRAILESLKRGEGRWEGSPVDCSRSRIQRLMEEGRVLCDGEPVQASSKLKPGALLEIRFPPTQPLSVEAEDLPVQILFQDAHLLIVNKPPGLSVHPSATQSGGTLVNALLHQMKTGMIDGLSGIGGVARPGIVHRLDKDTSGVLVVSKTDTAHRKLSEIFAAHAIEREYWALCYGCPPQNSMRIQSKIGRSEEDRKRMSMDVQRGREAITHLRRMEAYSHASKPPFASYLSVTLETGRTHQIRVHLTGKGFSVLGDPKYGAPTSHQPKWKSLPSEVKTAVEELPGQALHARVLGFDHPVTGKKLRFEAEPPPQFAELLKVLRRYL